MNTITPTFAIYYSRQHEHDAERQQLLARIAELEGQLREFRSPITEAEMRVLRLLAHGMSNDQIARRLYLHERTIRGHLHNIYPKLGVNTRTQAALYAWRNGYVSIDDAWNTVMAQEWGIE